MYDSDLCGAFKFEGERGGSELFFFSFFWGGVSVTVSSLGQSIHTPRIPKKGDWTGDSAKKSGRPSAH